MMWHLAACTLTALAALGATRALRGRRAAWRHAILFLALVRFAVPTAWIAASGSALVRVAPAPKVPLAANDLRWLLREPPLGAGPASLPARRPAPAYGVLLWVCGTLVAAALWMRRSIRAIPTVRAATEHEIKVFRRAAGGLPVRLRIVGPDHVPGALGCLRPSVILPDGLSAELAEAELEAVIAHELAHVRRRDNLVAAIARAIVSVFWFHPLVWWIEHRMLAERETACDELVLSGGLRAEDYAAGILKTCRMSFTGAAGYAGVTGSNLANRMEFIMSVDLAHRSSRAARALLAALLALIALLPAAGGYLKAQQPVPTEADQRFQEGLDLLHQRKFSEAEQAFREAQQLDPSGLRWLKGEVEILAAQSRWDDAIRLLQSELNARPDRQDIEMALGNTAVRAGRYDLAIETFNRVLSGRGQDSKTRADLYLRIGETYRRKGDPQSAIANLRMALQLAPDNVPARGTLALVLDGAGNRVEAEKEYRAALDRNPNDGVMLNNLAFLVSEKGDLEEALALARRAKESMPSLSEVSDTIGWVELKLNRTDEAIRQFDEIVRKEPANGEFRYHLGMALYAKGDLSSAAEQLRMALQYSRPAADQARKIQELLDAIGQ